MLKSFKQFKTNNIVFELKLIRPNECSDSLNKSDTDLFMDSK